MDYKMFKPDGGIDANTNVVSLIKESLGKDGLTLGSSLRFIGFEAEPGTDNTIALMHDTDLRYRYR